MKTNVNQLKRPTSASIKIPIAVLFDSEGLLHSAMASKNSLWSAGQRAFHAKKKGKSLVAEKTTLSISLPLAKAIASALRRAAPDSK